MIKKKEENTAINILWTGGWDSTFRLLQLVLLQRFKIQPFYLIDSDRLSTGIEIKTMKDIKKTLFKEYPYTAELILPTKFIEVNDLKSDSQINEAYNSILEKSFIGEQYEWLARFCKQHDIQNIELCIHKDDKAHKVVERYYNIKTQNYLKNYKHNERDIENPEKIIFQYFTFPIFDLTKIEMQNISKKNHWDHIMNMTWFCHRPRNGKTPCGECNPCIYTIDEGLGWRIPLYYRMRGKINRNTLRPIKHIAKKIFKVKNK